MAHDQNHDHEHEERELITLVDEQGNETLFEILLTFDGKDEFGNNYVLLIPASAEEDENGEVEYIESTDVEFEIAQQAYEEFMDKLEAEE